MTTSPTRVRTSVCSTGKTAATAPIPDCRRLLPGDDFAAGPTERSGIRKTSRRLRSSIAVVRAYGEIDASSADSATRYALRQSEGCRGVILDLRGVQFFATEGFSSLLRISVNCARRGAVWAVVPGPFASRVLQNL
ncbi:STAS domain-containing protein [Mycobacterium antarcticum]|uniref:STAS domain-containing protein n=1 Tax=unclassified Mycolicibacterium TaxID=2636767 RepID=UPI0032EA0BA5